MRFEEVVIGSEFMGLWHALIYQKQTKKTLFIQDESIRYDDPTLWSWSRLELMAFKKTCLKYEFDDQTYLDELTTPYPYLLCSDSRKLYLGQSVKRNLIELIKKFSIRLESDEFKQLLDYEDDFFDNWHYEHLDRWFKALNDSKFKFSFNKNPILDKVMNQLENILGKPDDPDYETLVMLISGFYEGDIKRQIDSVDYPYYFLRLVSPHHEIDFSSLVNYLRWIYLQSGGEIKKTSFKSWQFYQNEFFSGLCESFDGLVKAKRVSFSGDLKNQSFPFFFSHQPTYLSFSIPLQIRNNPKLPLIFWGNNRQKGTHYFWHSLKKIKTGYGFFGLYPNLPGSSFISYKSFLQKRAQTLLSSLKCLRDIKMEGTAHSAGSINASSHQSKLGKNPGFYLHHTKRRVKSLRFLGAGANLKNKEMISHLLGEI